MAKPAYPAMLMVARGSHAGGYQGAVVLVEGPPTRDRIERILASCGHSHRLTRTARACARHLARPFQDRYGTMTRAQLDARERAIWEGWKADDR
jgi:hypothetical protein